LNFKDPIGGNTESVLSLANLLVTLTHSPNCPTLIWPPSEQFARNTSNTWQKLLKKTNQMEKMAAAMAALVAQIPLILQHRLADSPPGNRRLQNSEKLWKQQQPGPGTEPTIDLIE
jgi:hypothetical protein